MAIDEKQKLDRIAELQRLKKSSQLGGGAERIDAQLLLEFVLDIYLCQDAKTLILESCPHSLERLLDGNP